MYKAMVLGTALAGLFLVGIAAAQKIPQNPPNPDASQQLPRTNSVVSGASAAKGRFENYDWGSVRPEISHNSPVIVAKTAADRRAFAGRLERAFLKAGFSADVWVTGKTLHIFMFQTKAMVYAFITKGAVVENALKYGFKKVEFNNTTIGGYNWIFDLSKGMPKCDVMRQLCF